MAVDCLSTTKNRKKKKNIPLPPLNTFLRPFAPSYYSSSPRCRGFGLYLLTTQLSCARSALAKLMNGPGNKVHMSVLG